MSRGILFVVGLDPLTNTRAALGVFNVLFFVVCRHESICEMKNITVSAGYTVSWGRQTNALKRKTTTPLTESNVPLSVES